MNTTQQLAELVLRIKRHLLVLQAKGDPMELPLYRFDGALCDAKDVAAALGMDETEAEVRLLLAEGKDAYPMLNAHDVQMGLGTTIQQRIGKFIQRRKKRRKKKRREPA